MATFDEMMEHCSSYISTHFSPKAAFAFMEFIEDEEIEETDVITCDLRGDVSTSAIVDFIGNKFHWEDLKRESFFFALQILFETHGMSWIDWANFNETDLKQTSLYLKKQCFGALTSRSNNKSFLTVQAIGRNHNINIVCLLFDVYSFHKYNNMETTLETQIMDKHKINALAFGYVRTSVDLYLSFSQIPMDILQLLACWLPLEYQFSYTLCRPISISHAQFCHNSDIVRSLCNRQQSRKMYQLLPAALATFEHEIMSPFSIDPFVKIADDINIYIRYTLQVTNMLNQIISNSIQCLPLLVDFWIIPSKVQEMQMCVNIDDSSNDSSDDSDDLSDSDYSLTKPETIPLDFAGILSEFETKYVERSINCYDEEKCNKILKTAFEKILNISRRSIKICIIIDTRKSVNNLLIYQLPLKYSAIPRNYCTETLLYSSGHHLMYDSIKHSLFGAKWQCEGKMFCLSFALQETNTNRIQFWHNGGGIRFWPNYMCTLWPKLFVNANIEGKYMGNDYFQSNFGLNVEDRVFDTWHQSIVIGSFKQ